MITFGKPLSLASMSCFRYKGRSIIYNLKFCRILHFFRLDNTLCYVERQDRPPDTNGKGMDETAVHLSFQGITTPMGVATYDNARAKEIAAHLPTAEELQIQISIAEKECKRG